MIKLNLDIEKLINYIENNFNIEISYILLVQEIAYYLKNTCNSLTSIYYKGSKAYIEIYVVNLIAMLNNSRVNITIEGLIKNSIFEEE